MVCANNEVGPLKQGVSACREGVSHWSEGGVFPAVHLHSEAASQAILSQ